MLFTSFEFIFIYAPLTVALFFIINSFSRSFGIAWLTIASLFFYSWWQVDDLPVLVVSIAVNYCIGELINKKKQISQQRLAKFFFVVGVSLNILALVYYKYFNFIIQSINFLLNTHITDAPIKLPLGISFFTFTQIAYLADCYTKQVSRYNMTNYALFVSYFPHLIAGPILHHNEMMNQFNYRKKNIFNITNISAGITLFSFGLFKKVVIADNIAHIANAIFEESNTHDTINMYMAWKGSLAYTLQLYFDFSGYSDMAIGLSRLMGIKLPINFHSPYKAQSIIDFWQRWHRTLSRFIRDYIYFPLGGSYKGKMDKYKNLFISMLLAGIWHGAGVTFVVWGLMHSLFLIINHGWRDARKKFGYINNKHLAWPIKFFNCLLCFFAVNFAWVMFRADSFKSALTMYRSMFSLGDWIVPNFLSMNEFEDYSSIVLFTSKEYSEILMLIASLLLVFFFPNTQQIMRKYSPAIGLYKKEDKLPFKFIIWAPTYGWSIIVSLVLIIALSCSLSSFNNLQFIYFRF
jgi:D-alanyl-lipoteichoic acid acyltransferase DltB (MBOAT superfamily)